MVKEANRRFLCKGQKIIAGEKLKSLNPTTGDFEFYEVVRIWGSHAVVKIIPEREAANALVVALTPEL